MDKSKVTRFYGPRCIQQGQQLLLQLQSQNNNLPQGKHCHY